MYFWGLCSLVQDVNYVTFVQGEEDQTIRNFEQIGHRHISKFVVCSIVLPDFLRPGRAVHCLFWSKNPGQKSGRKPGPIYGQKPGQKSSQKSGPQHKTYIGKVKFRCNV